DLDGDRTSYSREALAEQGLTPGAVRSVGELSFRWPGAPDGFPDTVVPRNQTLTLQQSARAVSLIGASVHGPSSGRAVATLDDGSEVGFVVGLDDWVLPTAATQQELGYTIVASMTSRNAGASTERTAAVMASRVFTAPQGRRISSITLPVVADQRLFALATDSSPAPTVSAADRAGAGTAVSVRGAGFGALQRIRVTADVPGAAPTVVTTDADGAFAARWVVPATLPSGTITLTARAVDSGLSASEPIAIAGVDHVIAAPTSGLADSSVTVTGRGFQAGERVDVRISRARTTGIVDDAGRFTAALRLPDAAGRFQIGAVGATSGVTALRDITVRTAPAPSPTVRLSATTVALGGSLTVTGRSFGASRVVLVQIGHRDLGRIRTSSSGAFTARWTVPLDRTVLGLSQVSAAPVDGGASATTPVRVVKRSVVPTVLLDPRTPTAGRVFAVRITVPQATGSVVLSLDGHAIARRTLGSAGSTTFSVRAPAAGSHRLRVVHSGDAVTAAAERIVTVRVIPRR
ncbi:MAG: hypothetical protein INR72_19435, partial [Williamsia herbipolensis]|nr:hypothetical protein [Williamsia herbipolensis]